MNAAKEGKASMLLRSMFGKYAKISLENENIPQSGILEGSVGAKVSLAGGVISLILLKVKTNSMAALSDVVLMVAGLGEKYGQPIVWADELSEAKQDYLREENIPFLDDAGNAWLSNQATHVDIRGRKSSNKTKVTTHRANIFSDKATIVMRILLEFGPMGIREISRVAKDRDFSLTPGYVSKMVASLEAQNYAVKDKNGLVVLRHKSDMLKDWVLAYRNLLPAQTKLFFLPVSDSDELVKRAAQATTGSALLSELAAASLIDPYASFDSVLLLARDFDVAVSGLIAAGAREVDRGSNIELALPRYKVSAFWGEQEVKKCGVASDLQIYLDLSRQPRRGMEAAGHLYERKLETMFSEADNYE